MKKIPLFIIFLVLIGFSISLGTEGRLGFAASSAIEPQAAGQPIFGCLGKKENLSPPADTTPPETTITSSPTSPTSAKNASFQFGCNEGNCTYECRMDGGNWSSCASPKTYSGLFVSDHTFEVRAWDGSGNVDQSPASHNWTVTFGTGWVEMGTASASGGGISNNSGWSCAPSITLGSDGSPIVAWADESGGNSEIYVKRWDGTAWVEMGAGSASGGGISNNSGWSCAPSITLGSDGSPIVAWGDDTEIYIKRWDGTAWVEMGTGSACSGGISNNSGASMLPSIVLGSDGNPIVVWNDFSDGMDTEIYIKKWDGSAWVEMGAGSASGGGISDNSGMSFENIAMVLDSDGNPIIAWNDSSFINEIYVKRWDGSAWVEMGTGSASGGGIDNNIGTSLNPYMALGSDGNPIITWQDDSGGDFEIYVKRWDGTAWVEMGAGSASGGGISDNMLASSVPSLIIGFDGNPIIAWDDSSSMSEIYVKRWDGTAWVEMGMGSASMGGISNSGGLSREPIINLGSNGNPVIAWSDDTGGDSEIYVRKWE